MSHEIQSKIMLVNTIVDSMMDSAMNLLSLRRHWTGLGYSSVSFSLGKLTSTPYTHLPSQSHAFTHLSSALKWLKRPQSLVGLQGTWPIWKCVMVILHYSLNRYIIFGENWIKIIFLWGGKVVFKKREKNSRKRKFFGKSLFSQLNQELLLTRRERNFAKQCQWPSACLAISFSGEDSWDALALFSSDINSH